MTGARSRVDVAALLERVDIVQVIDRYVPLRKRGPEYEACCPFHTEDTPSFKVSPVKQFYHCFGCGAHGNALSFLMAHQGLVFLEAVAALGGTLVSDSSAPAETVASPARKTAVRRSTAWAPVLPAPEAAPAPPAAHIKRGRPETTWCYRNAVGRVLGHVYRFRTSDGGKEVLPLVWARDEATGAEEWHWMAFPEPRPLYGLDRLAAQPEDTVLVVEGEKCADAGQAELAGLEKPLVVVSWAGGGKAVDKADWLPMAGRRVVLFADVDAKRVPLSKAERDAIVAAGDDDAAMREAQAAMPLLPEAEQPGVMAMARVAEILLGLGCTVWRVRLPAPGEVADGWDIADAVADGMRGEALADWLRGRLEPVSAAPVQASSPVSPAGAWFPPDLGGEPGLFDAAGRRVIQHRAGELPRVLDEMGAALAEYAGNLFAYGAGLARVHVLEAPTEGAVRRDRGAVVLHPVSSAHLVELAGRAARHEKYDGRSETWRPCDCPPKVAESYLARGFWPELPDLHGFVESPTLTRAGRVLDAPGYDAETGLFLAFAALPGYRSPPRAPSKAEAADASDVLFGAISTFPFVSDSDRNAAVAGLLLAVVRRSLPAAPMLAISAPTPGTGKTLLADTISMVATGRRAAVISLGHDEVEADKRLSGVLLAGDAMVLLDNVERPLGGDLLCQVLSQPVLKTRPLGASAMVEVPTHAVVAATGNNLSIQGDLKRRVTMIRLDAKLERPELRPFGGEPHLDKIMRMRGELITAAMTVTLAYLAAGAPTLAAPVLGGFEDWDRLVRRPLLWLGLADPLEASSLLRDQDPDMETTRALLTAWHGVFAGDEKTASEVVREGMTGGEGFDQNAITHPELHEALLMISGGRPPTSQKLGYWLRGHKDRIVDGLRVAMLPPDRNGISRWRVVSGEAGQSEEMAF